MEKIKTILITIALTAIAVLTMGAITQTKREAKKKAIDDRNSAINEIEDELKKLEKQENKNDETKTTQEISDDVDDLLDSDV